MLGSANPPGKGTYSQCKHVGFRKKVSTIFDDLVGLNRLLCRVRPSLCKQMLPTSTPVAQDKSTIWEKIQCPKTSFGKMAQFINNFQFKNYHRSINRSIERTNEKHPSVSSFCVTATSSSAIDPSAMREISLQGGAINNLRLLPLALTDCGKTHA